MENQENHRDDDREQVHVPYSTFSYAEKWCIVSVVSFAACFSTVSSFIYYPALHLLSESLSVPVYKINLTITSYMAVATIAPTLVGDAADVLGRRPVYVLVLTIYIVSNVAIALAKTYPALLGLRVLQALAISGTFSVAYGVITDIASPAERERNFSNTLQNHNRTECWPYPWRGFDVCCRLDVDILVSGHSIRYVPGIGGISSPRHIAEDRWEWVDTPPKHLRLPIPTMMRHWKEDGCDTATAWEVPNPLKSLRILVRKDNATVVLACGILYVIYTCVNASLSVLFIDIYGLNQWQTGLIYLPFGLGGTVSTFFSGPLLDNAYRFWRRLGQFPIEKARLGVIWAPMTLTTVSVVAFGWVLQLRKHIALPLALQFVAGLSMQLDFSIYNTLLVDKNHRTPAAAQASSNIVRCTLAAIVIAFMEDMFGAMGIGWTVTFLGESEKVEDGSRKNDRLFTMRDQHDHHNNDSPVRIKSEEHALGGLHDVRPDDRLTKKIDNLVTSPANDAGNPHEGDISNVLERQAAHQARMNEYRETHEAILNVTSNQYENETEYMQNQHDEILRLHGDVHRLQGRNRELEAQKVSLKDMISEMRRTADETVQLLKSNLSASEESEDAARKQCVELESAYNLALLELEAYKQSKPSFEVDDSTIAGKWTQLDNAIVEISSEYFRAHLQMDSFSHIQKTLYHSIYGNAEDHIENRTLAPFFFRAVIWHVIIEDVFLDSFSIFGKGAQEVAKCVRNNMSRNIVENLTSKLPQKHLTTRDRGIFRAQLVVISQRAAELASIFAQSKATYRILRRGPDSPAVRFNEEAMEMTNQLREGNTCYLGNGINDVMRSQSRQQFDVSNIIEGTAGRMLSTGRCIYGTFLFYVVESVRKRAGHQDSDQEALGMTTAEFKLGLITPGLVGHQWYDFGPSEGRSHICCQPDDFPNFAVQLQCIAARGKPHHDVLDFGRYHIDNRLVDVVAFVDQSCGVNAPALKLELADFARLPQGVPHVVEVVAHLPSPHETEVDKELVADEPPDQRLVDGKLGIEDLELKLLPRRLFLQLLVLALTILNLSARHLHHFPVAVGARMHRLWRGAGCSRWPLYRLSEVVDLALQRLYLPQLADFGFQSLDSLGSILAGLVPVLFDILDDLLVRLLDAGRLAVFCEVLQLANAGIPLGEGGLGTGQLGCHVGIHLQCHTCHVLVRSGTAMNAVVGVERRFEIWRRLR
ncbi:hypothetical protein PG997_013224 [Apiospora hydei]|uniref:Uncharacterized protein n=1 Tax=Apiospora hydei TaxID=1337664 RepID=A0ABR1V5L8_9PEZI